jgi:hypothetical protein
MTESYIVDTVVGGKFDGMKVPVHGSVTVTNRGEEIANFSTNLLDNPGSVRYNKEVSNVTMFTFEPLQR